MLVSNMSAHSPDKPARVCNNTQWTTMRRVHYTDSTCTVIVSRFYRHSEPPLQLASSENPGQKLTGVFSLYTFCTVFTDRLAFLL